MGFVGSLLGMDSGNSGGAGLNYQAGSADITQPVQASDAQSAMSGSQGDIAQQQNFLNALQHQNGIGNQTSVFNQQQALAGQLQDAANGGGPNPALAQLQNTTGQNVSTQAALMAGQRGASQNAGLIARQAAQQGAATQQNAVGQGAAMAAQQQIAARQALQQQQSMLGGLATQQVGQQAGALTNLNQFQQNYQQSLLNAIAQQNQAKVSAMASQNAANSAVSQQAAQQQGNLFGGVLSGIGSAFGLAHGGQVPPMDNRYDDGGPVSPPPPMQAQSPSVGDVAKQQSQNGPKSKAGQALKKMSSTMNPQSQQPAATYQAGQTAGSAIGKGIQAIGGLFKSSDPGSDNTPGTAPNLGVEGVDQPAQSPFNLGVQGVDSAPAESPDFSLGVADTFDDGGEVDFTPTQAVDTQYSIPSVPAASSSGSGGGGMGDIMKMLPMLAMAAAKGGRIPEHGVKRNDPVVGEMLASKGKRVPGKAKVKGDNLKNDVVPAMLSPGEVVIPRSIMNSPDAPQKAAEFVAKVMAKHRRK